MKREGKLEKRDGPRHRASASKEKFPLNTFKRILRIIASICFFIIGVLVLFEVYRFLFLHYDPLDIYFDLVSLAFPPLAVGLLLFCFSLWRPKPAYWSMYAFLWLLGIGMWFQSPLNFSTQLTGIIETPASLSPWLLLPVIGSLLLAVLYKPIMSLLTRIMNSPLSPNTQVKEAPFMEFEQQIQEYRGRED